MPSEGDRPAARHRRLAPSSRTCSVAIESASLELLPGLITRRNVQVGLKRPPSTSLAVESNPWYAIGRRSSGSSASSLGNPSRAFVVNRLLPLSSRPLPSRRIGIRFDDPILIDIFNEWGLKMNLRDGWCWGAALGKEGRCEALRGLERGFAFLAKCEK